MTDANSIAADQLRSICERVMRLHEDRKAIADDIGEVYAEAKANGFDVKVLKAVVAKLTKDPAEREEFDAVFELYWEQVGFTGPRARAHVRAA